MDDMLGTVGPHPDVRQVISDALNLMQQTPDLPDELRLMSTMTPTRLTFRCQRSWHNVPTWEPVLNGGSLSVCVVQFTDGDRRHSHIFEVVRQKGQAAWRCRSSAGGARPTERADDIRTFELAPGSHVIVGGLAISESLGALRVEHADGSAYEVPVIDGCAIAFAPVTTQPTSSDRVTVRYFDHSGAELGSDTVWIGDGGPPPSVNASITQ